MSTEDTKSTAKTEQENSSVGQGGNPYATKDNPYATKDNPLATQYNPYATGKDY